ncbi:hypothetical protein RI129_004679 [Pyrocoelia pectoralis]|uniref:Uncharacterized protein n=1 Tax=Pyrocoelia pectoralis TaxID=417401 RepID=A0AAN7VDC8_9COLE
MDEVKRGPFALKEEFQHPFLKSNAKRGANNFMKKTERRNPCNKHVESYLRNSTLHGLSYVGNRNISYWGRAFWLIAFAIGLSSAGYFIVGIFIKYITNPILISMNPSPIGMENVPFPAVTICNSNLAPKNVPYLSVDKDVTCSQNKISFIPPDRKSNQLEYIKEFLLNVSQPCKKMLQTCKWNYGANASCEDYFNVIATNEGICCTFNMIPLKHILRYPERSELNPSFRAHSEYRPEDWSPSKGYSKDAPFNVTPFRSPGPGSIAGLTFTLDADIENYSCSDGYSDGVKILLHNPTQLPNMQNYGFLLPFGYEIQIVYKPIIYDYLPSFEALDFNKRMCYFRNERYLRFYRSYSNNNCRMECLANKTLKECGCVPFYCPKANDTPICLAANESCVSIVKELFEQITENEDSCKCKPTCFQVEYDKVMSYGEITDKFQRKGYLKKKTIDYIRDNIIVVHVFYEITEFSRFTKQEVYGISDMISSVGGILGLFLGFSLLSIVEIVYHLSLKLICSSIRAKRQLRSEKNVIVVTPVPFKN